MRAFVGVGWAHHVRVHKETVPGVLWRNWGMALETASLMQELNKELSFCLKQSLQLYPQLSKPKGAMMIQSESTPLPTCIQSSEDGIGN